MAITTTRDDGRRVYIPTPKLLTEYTVNLSRYHDQGSGRVREGRGGMEQSLESRTWKHDGEEALFLVMNEHCIAMHLLL